MPLQSSINPTSQAKILTKASHGPLSIANCQFIYPLYVQVTVHRDKFRKNNQLDASISNIYFCHKTLHVSGIFCAHHKGLSTVHTAIGTFHAG